MNPVFTTAYRHPRESEGPGSAAATLPALGSRFRGSDEAGGNSWRFLDSHGWCFG